MEPSQEIFLYKILIQDGGSPLVCPISQNDPSQYFQNGIVAWGIGCNQAGVPAVYTNVAIFRDWIDNQVRNFGMDPAVYSNF